MNVLHVPKGAALRDLQPGQCRIDPILLPDNPLIHFAKFSIALEFPGQLFSANETHLLQVV